MRVAVLVPRLRIGGADAYMRDALCNIAASGVSPKVLLYVIHPSGSETSPMEGIEVVPIRRSLSANQRLMCIKSDMLRRNVGVVFTQLISLAFLNNLWSSGIRTALVFQNEEPTWSYCPAGLSGENVPFLLTSCEALSGRLQALTPGIPVRVIRPMPDSPTGTASRDTLRQSWSIPSDAVVIGMIGTFKLHKRYTQAVRVLSCLRTKGVNAYLVIVGGHAELYGGGEQAYVATQRLASELGILPYLRCPGELTQPGDLYQAFDVFMNTSVYEGLSRATVSASAQGCPIVATDVGGQAEILSAGDRALPASSSPVEFAEAVISCLSACDKSAQRPALRTDRSLVISYQWQFVWRTLYFLAQGLTPNTPSGCFFSAAAT